MTLCIEVAGAADLTAIARVNVLAFEEFSGTMAADHWAAMKAQVSLPRVEQLAEFAQFFVIRHQGPIVGSIAYCPPGRSRAPIPSAWASILLLAVAPGHRDRRLGRTLIDTCMQRARDDRAPAVGLYTSASMTTAHHLYEQAGFQRVDELPPRHGLRYFLYRHTLDAHHHEHKPGTDDERPP